LKVVQSGLRSTSVTKTTQQRISIDVDAKNGTRVRISCLQANNWGSGRFTPHGRYAPPGSHSEEEEEESAMI